VQSAAGAQPDPTSQIKQVCLQCGQGNGLWSTISTGQHPAAENFADAMDSIDGKNYAFSLLQKELLRMTAQHPCAPPPEVREVLKKDLLLYEALLADHWPDPSTPSAAV
jgi:hypothetical protein